MSRVIKAVGGDDYTSVSSVSIRPANLSMQLHAVEAQAHDMLEKSKSEAELIVRTALAEADSVREAARSEGYGDGLRVGMQEASQNAQALIDRLEADIAAVTDDRKSIVDATERDLLKLCIESVEKIIRHEIKTDPNVVIRMIKSCLRRVKDCTDVYVHVNPAEIDFVRSQREELLHICEGVRSVNIVDDRRISCGGCVVESSSGDFDAKIDTQTDRLRLRLMETFENDHHGTCS